MKKTEKFVVIRNTETGNFLVDYKSNKASFAYTANWSEDLQNASTISVSAMEKQGDEMRKTAEAFGGELSIVNATYELKTLDGKEPEDLTEKIEKAKRKGLENLLRGILESNFDEDDEDDEEE